SDQIDPDDVGVDAARWREAHHLGQPGAVMAKQALGQAAGPDDLLSMVEIVHEGVERTHPLLDAARQPPPFGTRYYPRHHVARDQPPRGGAVAIDVEGTPRAAEEILRFASLAAHPVRVLVREPAVVIPIGLANRAVGRVHLVVLDGARRVHEFLFLTRCTIARFG